MIQHDVLTVVIPSEGCNQGGAVGTGLLTSINLYAYAGCIFTHNSKAKTSISQAILIRAEMRLKICQQIYKRLFF